MDYNALAKDCEFRSEIYRMQHDAERLVHEKQCEKSILYLIERAEKAERERDELASLCGKLITLCDQPQEWRAKLFRRIQGNMIGDYMGSGYPFVDGFDRIFENFQETASDGAYQAVIKAVDDEVKKCVPEKEE